MSTDFQNSFTGRLSDTFGEVRDKSLVSCFYSPDAMLARVLAVAACLCVCLSACLSRVGVLLKQLNESSWFLAPKLPSTHPALCYEEIRVSSEIRALPSGTLSQTLDLKNFAPAYDSRNVIST